MSVKKLIAIVMVLIMVLTISACGSKPEKPAQSTGSEGTQGSVETQKAPFGMADPKSYKATLTMWSHTADQPNFMIKHYS